MISPERSKCMMSDSKTKNSPEDYTAHALGVNLTEAIRLICHAGHPDPRLALDSAEEEQLLQKVIDALCTLSMSMQDGLTGLSNLRYFQIAIKQEIHRAARDGTTCALLMVDIDHFKSVNDVYGHPAGDAALINVAERLKVGLRPGDTISRYGGEEFAILLPNCPLKYALQVAERVRLSVSEEKASIGDQTLISMTVSIGAAEASASSPLSAEGLIKLADDNLYKAKTLGRNQTYSVTPITSTVSELEKSALFNQDQQTKQKRRKRTP